MKKKLIKWGSIITALGIALLTVACMSLDFRMKPAEVDAYFQARQVKVEQVHYTHEGRPMHYVATGQPGAPLVLFVHGSPGSWDNFISFLGSAELIDHARLVSVDRPGFGGSGYGVHQPSMAVQAADIAPIIEVEGGGRPAILVGHSLGGPVVARLAMDFPERVSGLILVAPSIDPDLEKTRWFQIPAEWPVLSWMVPKALRVTNREILPLKGELEAMVPLWSKLEVPVTVIQGEKDKLVPAGNADFAARLLKAEQLDMVRVADMNHFVPWNRPDLIFAAVERHLARLRRP